MKRIRLNLYKMFMIFSVACLCLTTSCNKGIEVPLPINLITAEKVFINDQTATSAVVGIYSQMMSSSMLFASSAMTIFPGLSSDEIYSTYPDPVYDLYFSNSIPSTDFTISGNFWRHAYNSIYQANACIEGLSNSTSISKSTQNELIGETKFIRAFCYFYLTNLFGDVPLIVSTDYKINSNLNRSPVSEVYSQIILDLKDAQSLLSDNYIGSGRVRPNKFTATALLARVYLYQKDWVNAEVQSTIVISSNAYQLEADLNNVFLAGSNEAIWQLLPVYPYYGNNTFEGAVFVPYDTLTVPTFSCGDNLVNAFDSSDLRKKDWIGLNTIDNQKYYFPYKYKIIDNEPDPPLEYNMVLRYAEQFLIRAEARAEQGNISGAAEDINIIRNRAGLNNTSAASQNDLLLAVEHERQVELCFEWGHRWFDLKRTSRIDQILSVEKAPNWDSHDSLYPIPFSEIQLNPSLTQNPGY